MTLAELASLSVDMEPHTGTLCRLAGDADVIVELGVRFGVSTWALLDGLKPDGRMTSVDIDDVRAGLHERITTDPRWTFLYGDDRDDWTAKRLPAADLVFIDTSHEYHHTLAELGLAASLGARRIALHDWNVSDVQDAASRFMVRHPVYRLWLLEPSEWGLAVLAR